MPFLNALYAASLLLHLRPDIVHCQFGSLGPRALLLKNIGSFSAKLITSFRGADTSRYVNDHPGIYDDLFIKGDLFLPVCQALKQRLINLGCDASKINVHHSGIDLAKFKYKKRNIDISRNEIISLLTVVRFVEKKGVTYAIDASSKLHSMSYNIKHIFVGDGELRSELERKIESMGIKDIIQMCGWKTHDEIYQLLSDTHILVAPSITANDGDQEGIPNAIKEAMAMGIPVVSTKHGGIPELVQDGISGFLVDERDSDALANHIMHLIDHPEIWSKMGLTGRKHIEENFDMEKLNNQLVNLYEKLILLND